MTQRNRLFGAHAKKLDSTLVLCRDCGCLPTVPIECSPEPDQWLCLGCALCYGSQFCPSFCPPNRQPKCTWAADLMEWSGLPLPNRSIPISNRPWCVMSMDDENETCVRCDKQPAAWSWVISLDQKRDGESRLISECSACRKARFAQDAAVASRRTGSSSSSSSSSSSISPFSLATTDPIDLTATPAAMTISDPDRVALIHRLIWSTPVSKKERDSRVRMAMGDKLLQIRSSLLSETANVTPPPADFGSIDVLMRDYNSFSSATSSSSCSSSSTSMIDTTDANTAAKQMTTLTTVGTRTNGSVRFLHRIVVAELLTIHKRSFTGAKWNSFVIDKGWSAEPVRVLALHQLINVHPGVEFLDTSEFAWHTIRLHIKQISGALDTMKTEHPNEYRKRWDVWKPKT